VKARGFTLIEVLVALAIVVVGIGALLGSLTSAADTTTFLRDKTFAQWIALNRIAEVRLKGEIKQGKTEGNVDDFAGRRWHWEQAVQPIALPGAWRIEVSVRPADSASKNKGAWYATESGIWGDAVDYKWDDATHWDIETPEH
jgi:general secretion pathway protein I